MCHDRPTEAAPFHIHRRSISMATKKTTTKSAGAKGKTKARTTLAQAKEVCQRVG